MTWSISHGSWLLMLWEGALICPGLTQCYYAQNSCNTYSFGKTNSRKGKLDFISLGTNLAIGSTNFIEIMNQVHFRDNQFSFNFQSIPWHVMNNFMIWYPYSYLHKINFIKSIIFFQKKWHKNFLSSMWPNIIMFDDFGDCSVIHGYDVSKYLLCNIEIWTIWWQ